MSTETYKCPVCKAELTPKETDGFWRFECTSCPMDFGRFWFNTKKELLKEWEKVNGTPREDIAVGEEVCILGEVIDEADEEIHVEFSDGSTDWLPKWVVEEKA